MAAILTRLKQQLAIYCYYSYKENAAFFSNFAHGKMHGQNLKKTPQFINF